MALFWPRSQQIAILIGALASALVLGPILLDSGYFNPAFLREMVDSHQSGARDHGVTLWSLLMFEAFLRKVMGASATQKFKVAV